MSSITQARLAPITQRYMSISFRRQDWNDRSISTRLNSEPAAVKFDRNIENVCDPLQSSSRCRPASRSGLHTIDRNRRFHKRSLDYQRCRGNVSLMNPGSIEYRHGGSDVLRNDQTHSRARDLFRRTVNTNPSHRLELPPALPLDKYLLRVKRKINDMFNVADMLTISKTSPGSHGNLLHRCWKYERSRSRGGESEQQDTFNQRPFYITLAVLGLFRKPTESEIEEGRERLTDEQKVEKMKPIELKIARGVLSMCDQEFGRANQLFHEALHIAQDEDDEERENLILNLIAANYFESGELEKAEKLFIDIMKRLINHDVAPTAPPILELSLKLASIYSKDPRTHEKALKGFKFVINSLLFNLEDIVNQIEDLDIQSIGSERRDELALLGWSYDWFAKHLLAMNDYGGAADMLQRAVQISSLVLGPLHDQTLILLNDIGTTLAMNNSPEEGKIFINKAVEGAIANQSKELASFYVNLGLVNLRLSKFGEAKRYCEYSMELAKKNRDHYNTQEVIELSRTCLDEISRLLDAEGQ